ncbi:hypothetical protein NFI96_003419 [Prochilodus magdalenae]|nr:hypothetical protein NFI96_003419 [Prochilodus magdalenae]
MSLSCEVALLEIWGSVQTSFHTNWIRTRSASVLLGLTVSGPGLDLCDVGSVEGLAYHRGWDALYWTSSTTATITRHSVDQSRPDAFNLDKVVRMAEEDHPHVLALDECQNLMFWTNWNERHPSILRSTLSGRNVRLIVSERLLTPNGLTIDHRAEKLYFSDGSLGSLERCDYDGSRRHEACGPTGDPVAPVVLPRQGHQAAVSRLALCCPVLPEAEQCVLHLHTLLPVNLIHRAFERRTDRELARRTDRELARRTDRELARRTDRELARRTDRELARRTDRELARQTDRELARRTDRQLARRTDRELARRTDRELARRTDRELARRTDRELARGTDRELARRTDRELARGLARGTDRELARETDRELARQTDRELARQTDRELARQTDRELARQTDRELARQTDRELARRTNRELARQTDRELARQRASQTDGQRASQTDGQRASQTDGQRASQTDGQRASQTDGQRASQTDGQRASQTDARHEQRASHGQTEPDRRTS